MLSEMESWKGERENTGDSYESPLEAIGDE